MEKIKNEAIKVWGLAVANKKITIGIVVAIFILYHLINRLVNTKTWSVENTSKWITDEHEEGSYDYHYTNLEDKKND